MRPQEHDEFRILVIITPGFNMAATMSFVDPFRAANYLGGRQIFRWMLAAAAPGEIRASNGVALTVQGFENAWAEPSLAMVSSSWEPEASYGAPIDMALRRWARRGAVLGGIDTGAFVLAQAGLLRGRRATVHYEHLDAFAELFPNVEASEDLYVIDRDRATACGGGGAVDLALQIIRSGHGDALANAAARYVFHDRLRPQGERQNPERAEPLGATAPAKLRAAIALMERSLEETVSIPDIAAAVSLSQRQLERVFHSYAFKSPRRYYSDIRLDRARGLVTQTDLPLREVALACGFSSPEHFSRAYRGRFGLAPRTDRVEGRVPFEFRPWPMHPARPNARRRVE